MAKQKVKMIVADTRKSHLNRDLEIDDGQPETVQLDERQRHINRLLGIGDDVFLKYSRGLHGTDPVEQQRAQSVIDAFHHAGDMVFAKYQDHPEKWSGIIDECQRRVNELMGIKDEDFLACLCKEEKKDPAIDETQRRTNELMGVDDAMFRKYNK
ncbi:MAG: hypothetical protein NTY16_06695 [Deltaproteobacteria bacterium]|nr:hypothetical protein [Deltaproteobacteria bacterium]